MSNLASAVGEQLACEGGSALGCRDDFLGVMADGFWGLRVALDHLGVALDDGKEVVEIVGDAACELTDGFSFLDLSEVCLEAHAVGDVDAVCVNDLVFADGKEVPLKDVFAKGMFEAF